MEKSFAIAFGGGAALGIVHVGVIKYLMEKDINITHLSGTSAGSIAAAALALGVTVEQMENYCREIRWRKFTAFRFPRKGLLSSEVLMKRLEDLLGDKTFDEVQIPLAIVATDLVTNQRVVLNKGRILPAVAASCAVPGIFEPVYLENKILCDGGLKENVPVKAAEELGARKVIAIDLTTGLLPQREPGNIFEIILRSIHILLEQTLQYDKSSHIIIAPDLKDYTPFDIHRGEDLIKIGYDAAKNILENYWFENS